MAPLQWTKAEHPGHPWRVTTVCEAAGGDAGLLRLAVAWHRRVVADEVVGHAFRHGVDPHHTQRLATYWAEAVGAPPNYSASYGDGSAVLRVHSGNGAHDDMDEQAIRCFREALADAGLASEPVGDALLAYFTWATTNYLNGYPRSPTDVPVGLPVPRWSWSGAES